MRTLLQNSLCVSNLMDITQGLPIPVSCLGITLRFSATKAQWISSIKFITIEHNLDITFCSFFLTGYCPIRLSLSVLAHFSSHSICQSLARCRYNGHITDSSSCLREKTCDFHWGLLTEISTKIYWDLKENISWNFIGLCASFLPNKQDIMESFQLKIRL